MTSSSKGLGAEFENPPPNEPALIDSVAQLTSQLLARRYAGKRVLRGVHPKDHGCVEATFIVAKNLAPEYRVGVFKNPGEEFRAAIRFSNCAGLVADDSPAEQIPTGAKVRMHGSRGMAIKLYDVAGNRLQPQDGERSQDFLMINQPVFAFANVEDYEVLNQVILADLEKPDRFFQRAASPDMAVKMRALKSLAIVREVKSPTTAPPPPMNPPFPTLPYPYQAPPLSPLDNRYFSAAPFAFGPGRVMKYSVNPSAPVAGELGAAIDDPDYLRKAMRARMAQGGIITWFDFQVQVRDAASLAGKLDNEMENMCTLWDEKLYPFVTVARIAIAAQDVSQPDRQEFCETLFFTPWHGLEDHRPLGGINRMRKKVYEASSVKRGCPVSPQLPAKMGRGGGRPPPGGARR